MKGARLPAQRSVNSVFYLSIFLANASMQSERRNMPAHRYSLKRAALAYAESSRVVHERPTSTLKNSIKELCTILYVILDF